MDEVRGGPHGTAHLGMPASIGIVDLPEALGCHTRDENGPSTTVTMTSSAATDRASAGQAAGLHRRL
ncbi:hypothetical protein E1286_30940 [Nonomuraea terrae]|uniref:Uncharacterized protein n=1 Tax=Nonomuraea terrae TaxID=2530383 RepID=A0A4R4YCK6_9ACTN|nr:hypothetical protein [Nonomuraea terrae]TDD42345.1 hypothetical protein E1286_30940 [Nonomuraea terrae]